MANDNISEVLARNGLNNSNIGAAHFQLRSKVWPGRGTREALETVARLLATIEPTGFEADGDERKFLDARAILAEVLK